MALCLTCIIFNFDGAKEVFTTNKAYIHKSSILETTTNVCVKLTYLS